MLYGSGKDLCYCQGSFDSVPARLGKAIDENMGTNLQAFYKHFYISCLKTQKQQLHFFFFFRARRKTVRAGRSALGNMPSWNTVWTSQIYLPLPPPPPPLPPPTLDLTPHPAGPQLKK